MCMCVWGLGTHENAFFADCFSILICNPASSPQGLESCLFVLPSPFAAGTGMLCISMLLLRCLFAPGLAYE